LLKGIVHKGTKPVTFVESGLDFYKIRGRVRMKRFAGIFVLLLLASISIAGCYGGGGGCPHGVCDEEHSPKGPEN